MGTAFIWIYSLALAVGPLLELDGHVFYQSAHIKNSLFFKNWDVSFDALQAFALKLLEYHPNVRNLTTAEMQTVVATDSWETLSTFLLKTTSDERYHPKVFYG